MNLAMLFILICSQFIFTISDILGRANMPKHGFTLQTFLTSWFAIYFFIRIFATFGQLYIFTQSGIGRTMTLFGASGLILANIIGLLLFKETLSPTAYFGVFLAIIAFFLVAFS